MVNAAAAGRVTPAVLIIEDVHWIDEISGVDDCRVPLCGSQEFPGLVGYSPIDPNTNGALCRTSAIAKPVALEAA